MGSNHGGEFGQQGSGRSTRRGKRNGSEKPKQPQRGLGVAQLEKMRIQSQLMARYNTMQSDLRPFLANLSMEDEMGLPLAIPSSSSPSSSHTSSVFSLHSNLMMGYRENFSSELRLGESQPAPARFSSHHELPVTLPLMEDSVVQKRKHHDRSYSAGSFSHASDSSDSQELDLDLRLSL